jgi:uncharacterized membrane protein
MSQQIASPSRPVEPDQAGTVAPVSPARVTLAPVTNALLGAFTMLTAAGATVLYGSPSATDRLFAWTIEPPITAAFLGGGYLAGFVLSAATLRAGRWEVARVPVLTVLVFVLLTLAATLLHLDRFHLGAERVTAHLAAWIWLGVYLVVPGIALAVVRAEWRRPPGPTERPLPMPAWLAALLAAEGAVLFVVGVTLFVAPDVASPMWPWPLTPLTARVVAAWLVALGAAALLVHRERDLIRLRASSMTYAVFGLAQLGAVARYPTELAWSEPWAYGYVTLLSLLVATGLVGWWLGGNRRSTR